MEWLISLALLLYGGVIALLAVRIVMRRRPVGVTLAWMLLLFALPVAGVVAYLMFGERYLGRLRAERGKQIQHFYQSWLQSRFADQDLPESAPVATLNMHRLVSRTMNFPLTRGNQWQLLSTPDTILDALALDIERAQQAIFVEFYICEAGGRVDAILERLENAAQRGIEVRMLLDSVGSHGFLRSKRCEQLRERGVEVVEVLYANPFRMLLQRIDLRQHRKIVTMDNRVAYTGSMNLVDPREFKQQSGVGQWIDLMVRLEGPVAVLMQGSLVFDWEMETGERLAHLLGNAPVDDSDVGAPMQLLPSGPGTVDEAILLLLLNAIYSAREELIITTPYFVPDDTLVHALKSAALSGVKVKIYLPRHNDSKLADYAGRSFYAELLLAGVEIHRFYDGLLHTKCVLIDCQTVLLGTVNLDMRSLWLNFENTLLVNDVTFAAKVHEILLGYEAKSRKLSYNKWSHRPAHKRLLENLAQLFSPLL